MASIYYGKLAIQSVTVTDAASGYPGSNIALESLGRPWRSADTGTKTVVLDLGGSLAINSLFLHDVNFTSAAIDKSADNVTYTSVGTLTTYSGRHGRRRGRITVGATTRYLRVTITTGTPADGLAYWRIGAGYVLSSKVTPTSTVVAPAQVKTMRPQSDVALPNGIDAVASLGNKIDKVALHVAREYDQSADDFIQRADAGSVVVDAENPNYPELIWPMRIVAAEIDENFAPPNSSDLTVPFVEIV